jgi:hypothetical protein
MRFGIGAFLAFWLCGWAAGEAFALRWLVWSVLGGAGSPAARAAAQPMGWVMGGFLLVWTIFWTIGGVAALFHFVRLMAGVDRLTWTPETWELRRAAGPFGRTRSIPSPDVRGLYIKRTNGPLMLETSQRTFEVTSFGTPQERHQALEQFGARIPPRPESELPANWIAERDIEGLTRVRRARFESPGCLAFVAIIAILPLLFAARFRSEIPRSATIAVASLGLLLSALFLWGLFSQREWHARQGYLARHVRWLSWSRTTPIDPSSLNIERSTDSDGDERASLVGMAGGRKITLLSSINDDREVTRLHAALLSLTG